EVALWSGGLDSLAGLFSRIKLNSADRYLLVGSGISSQVQGSQSAVFELAKTTVFTPMKLMQIPIHLRYFGEEPPKNDMFRARGFTFKILGAVCAFMEGQRKLYIYENGYGAINLPFLRSETGLSHTRSVHPLSLIETSAFVGRLLGLSFSFDNPFLFVTKAQMCKSLADVPDLAFRTVSCDGRHRQPNQPSQCGYCSSCLLRRVALINALDYDETDYVITHRKTSWPSTYTAHFEAMQVQAEQLQMILESHNPWERMLERYTSLRLLVEQVAASQQTTALTISEKLLNLYHCYVNEWRNVQAKIQRSFQPCL
ncbi:MAG TPA: hypothetical protein PKE45_11225, partial [Caldilineaceae bacterium]|nr:hypothetical protein [Caldilineaceae bacterium]